ncbi:MAG: SGNH/GDSL hydrolase family protein [Atopobiaceae bacterium]|nr:SGNH/GDSL hydrolase family protein [Atopobiaceae bacterium]
MGVREYIGMRYVPVFADPVEWDDTRAYESLTIVTYQGASYTSRRPVPAGIPITDGRYWVLTGNYNDQVEQYRREVRAFDGRITQAQTDASNALTQVGTVAGDVEDLENILTGYGEGDTVKADISTLQGNITALDTKVGTLPEGETSVIGYVDGEVQTINTDLTDIDTTLAGFSPSVPVKPYIDAAVSSQRKKMLVIGDSLSGSTYVAANARWCVLLAARLNADLYVFQSNGAGYAEPGVGGKTFQTLVADAHTSTQFDDEDIDYLFIFGGTNDISETMLPSAISGAFDDTLTAARGYFPNAKLYICSTTARYDHLKLVSATRQGEVYQLKAWRNRPSFAATGAIMLPLTFVLGFNESYYLGGSDHIHLNASGHQKVANAIWDMMNGIPVSVYFTGAMQAVDDSSVGVFRCNASPIGLQVFGYTQAAAGSDSYLHDQFLIFRDAGFDNFWNGIGIAGANGGYIGGYSTENNGLHFVGYGGFNGYVPLA